MLIKNITPLVLLQHERLTIGSPDLGAPSLSVAKGVSIDDFYSYMPMHQYIFAHQVNYGPVAV